MTSPFFSGDLRRFNTSSGVSREKCRDPMAKRRDILLPRNYLAFPLVKVM
eukprot:UN04559